MSRTRRPTAQNERACPPTGRFGDIRILERKSDGARLYCIDDSVQTMIQPDGVSMFGYVHAAKLPLMAAHKIPIIGGAGGSPATMLARTGRDVTVLDVDPAAEALARTRAKPA